MMTHFFSAVKDNAIPTDELLSRLVATLRPDSSKNITQAVSKIERFIQQLKKDETVKKALQNQLLALLRSKNQIKLLTELGIQPNSGFFSELYYRLTHKLLPAAPDTQDLHDILDAAFGKNNDYTWVQTVPTEAWAELIAVVFSTNSTSHRIATYHLDALLLLSHRVAAMGIEREITSKINDYALNTHPFILQNKELASFCAKFYNEDSANKYEIDSIITQLRHCKLLLKEVRDNKQRYGASIKLTYYIQSLNQSINRTLQLLFFITEQNKHELHVGLASFLKELVTACNNKHSVRGHIKANTDLIAYQVVEHAGRTGEHYITNSRKEYFKFFYSAMGGGAFVALMAILKVFVYYWHLPPFPEAFFYSMIYSIGFIIILITGSTLATKQPAMTAATIASSLHETKENEVSISNMVLLIAKTSRSQFVAFIGNLVIVFPLAWLLAWAYHWCYGTHIMDLAKAHKSIHEVHPWQSGALFYAAFAGVFLFLAGIISGYYDNKVVYNQIPQRLIHHKLFKKVLGVKLLGKLSHYVERQLGSLAGNFYLGIFLGSAATIGFMFGIPLEVRHITISTGSLAIAFASQNNHITTPDLISSVLGIIGIGFLNFAVSFGLALLLALKSRGVHFQQKRELLRELRLYIIKKPTAFFFPTKDSN